LTLLCHIYTVLISSSYLHSKLIFWGSTTGQGANDLVRAINLGKSHPDNNYPRTPISSLWEQFHQIRPLFLQKSCCKLRG
jgi:hypothetical protein